MFRFILKCGSMHTSIIDKDRFSNGHNCFSFITLSSIFFIAEKHFLSTYSIFYFVLSRFIISNMTRDILDFLKQRKEALEADFIQINFQTSSKYTLSDSQLSVQSIVLFLYGSSYKFIHHNRELISLGVNVLSY